MHQLKTQWTWIWQYICLKFKAYLSASGWFWIFSNFTPPHNDGSVIAEVSNQCDASLLWREIQSFIKGSYKVMDRGSGVGMETRMLPPCYPKHEPKGLRCFSSKIKLKVVFRWFGCLKAGVVISVLGWAMRLLYRKLNVDQHRCWALLTPSTNPNGIYLIGALPGHGRGAFESSYVCRSGEESFSRFWRSSAPAARQGVMQLRRMDEILAMANISVCLLWQCVKHPNWCRIVVYQWQLEDLQSFSSLRATPQGVELLR